MTRFGRRGVAPVLLVLGVFGSAASPTPASADRGCLAIERARTQHISLWLSGLPAGATAAHPFYVAAEDEGTGRFQVLAGAHVCNESASARYATTPDTATSADFERAAGRASFTIVHTTDPWEVEVPVVDDGEVEAPIESFRVALSNPRNGSLRVPFEAPFHIVDADGADRATLDGEPYGAGEFDGTVEVAVFRAGVATGSLAVPFLVEASGPEPATPDEDYTVTSANPLTFGPGERVKVIQIAITDDGLPEPDETFGVTLPEAASDGVGEATVTIDGEIDASPPRSRFHHPRHRWTYAPDDYRIREIHVFTDDGGESGVVRMNLALRRNSADGSCAWWDGDGFRRGGCSEPRWFAMRAYERGWFYYYRIDALPSSVGTRIRSYTAYAQGVDAADNVEEAFVTGRNRNTFEVDRR